ncbi:MAG: radical SAM protein [Thermoplasmatales archaeon]|nr:radical SAM protein [Thermoplasmatales archaeon]
MRIVILDGYVDEPACLGVPPYISPLVRYVAGAVKDSDNDFTYLTIDEYRKNSDRVKQMMNANILILVAGAVVPGKYLRAMPVSSKEIREINEKFDGIKIAGGARARFELDNFEGFDWVAKKDLDASVYDFLTDRTFSDRNRTIDEWNRWSVKGADIVRHHPDFPLPLIAEVETMRGCVRYFTGGCSFCIEPLYGKPVFRDADDIVKEIKALNSIGVVNFRLTQSCLFSYKAKGIGETETPTPNPDEIKKLLAGIRKGAPNLNVLHVDNANPAIIAEHPFESEKIMKILVKYCTPGNVLALGMESADPSVIKANNLNATPEQVMKSIELINKIGRERGINGMPMLLPGINIVCGLKDETKKTYELNYDFLKKVLGKGLLLRRINIRRVLGFREKFPRKHHSLFVRYKEKIRKEVDRGMLKKIVPFGTILKDVFMEKGIGNTTFGRQIGSYPLLVGIPYKIPENIFINVSITDWGMRSITGIEYPFNINKASLKAVESLPCVGKKRAMRIVRTRPFKTENEFINCFDDKNIGEKLLSFLEF